MKMFVETEQPYEKHSDISLISVKQNVFRISSAVKIDKLCCFTLDGGIQMSVVS